MTLKEFLSLPRRKKNPRRRLQEAVRELREEIDIVPCEDEIQAPVRCCGKETFLTEEDAMLRLQEIKRDSKSRSKKPHRVYECPQGRWHLTSRGKKEHTKKFWY